MRSSGDICPVLLIEVSTQLKDSLKSQAYLLLLNRVFRQRENNETKHLFDFLPGSGTFITSTSLEFIYVHILCLFFCFVLYQINWHLVKPLVARSERKQVHVCVLDFVG